MGVIDRRDRQRVDQTIENKIEQLRDLGHLDYMTYNILLNAFRHAANEDDRKTKLTIKHSHVPTGERTSHFSFTITIEGEVK